MFLSAACREGSDPWPAFELLSGSCRDPPIAVSCRLTSRSIERRESRSDASQKDIAMPPLPARAVRPIR
jgi:hypothetical protein